MTPRERFRRAIRHEEPDRVPVDVGQDFHNGIHEIAYRNLLEHLGETDDIRLYDQMQHLAVVKQSVLDRLHADTRYVFANAPAGFTTTVAADGSWADEWGVRRKPCGYYDESCHHPLAGCDLAAVRGLSFPRSIGQVAVRGAAREGATAPRDDRLCPDRRQSGHAVLPDSRTGGIPGVHGEALDRPGRDRDPG